VSLQRPLPISARLRDENLCCGNGVGSDRRCGSLLRMGSSAPDSMKGIRGRRKVLDFHVDFNERNYDRIYEPRRRRLHAEPSERDKFVKTLGALHAKLSNARRSSLEHIEVTITNGEPLVITRYQTYLIADRPWKL